MKTDDYYLDLIEDYTEGLLDEAGRADFEAKLQTDPQLTKLYQKYQEGQQLLELQAGQLIKAKLQALNPNKKSETPTRVISFRRYILAAAAVVALLILIIGFRGVKNQYTNEALLETYGSVYATGPSRGGSASDRNWEKGAQAYLQKDYQKAIELFSEVKADNPRFLESQFFIGNSALLIGKYDIAEIALKMVVEAEDVRFSQAAEWYMVLTALGQGNEAWSRELAKKIFDTQNHPYFDQTRNFVKDLDSFWR